MDDDTLTAEERERLQRQVRAVPQDWVDVLFAMGGDLTVAEWQARSGLDEGQIRAVLRLRRDILLREAQHGRG